MSIIDYRTLDFKAASEVLEGKNIVFTGRGFLVRSELMSLVSFYNLDLYLKLIEHKV